MSEIHDWRRVDPRAVLQYAVQSLAAGRTVAFPTETGYAVTASGLIPEAVRQLRPDSTGEPLTLAVRGAEAARDWAPEMSPLAQRLARRLWPGPVTLIVGGAVEQGLASRLPDDVRLRVCLNGTLRLAMPGHEALSEVLRHLPGPLLLAPVASEGGAAVDAEQVARRAGGRVDVILDDGPASHTQPDTLVAVNGDSWQVVRAGAVSAEQVRRQTACLIVFICTGNTCRSPLAEALCKKCLTDRLGCTIEELPARGFHILSAGLAAAAGGPAAEEAEQVARAYGADLSAHRSQPLTPELAGRADYLVGMSAAISPLWRITSRYRGLSRLLDPAGDIADPIGRDRPVYEECGRQIWRQMESLVSEIARKDEG